MVVYDEYDEIEHEIKNELIEAISKSKLTQPGDRYLFAGYEYQGQFYFKLFVK